MHLKPKAKNTLGFTLIELLVVVAIIGLLSSIISVAVNSSRMRARDARRITDLKQIKTGMDLFFSNGSGYPDTPVWNASVGSVLQCDSKDVLRIPEDPLASTQGYHYTYTATGGTFTGCGVTVRSEYQVEFYIENKGLYYYMNEDGNVFDKNTGAPTSFDTLL